MHATFIDCLQQTKSKGISVCVAAWYVLSCSAWSCHRWAERLKRGDAFVGGDLRVAHSVQCLQGFCYHDNLLWAALACVTGLCECVCV